jgi:hypothetical protein
MKISVRVFRIPKKLTVRRVWICIIFSFLLLIVDWGDFTLNPKFSRDEIRTVSDCFDNNPPIKYNSIDI